MPVVAILLLAWLPALANLPPLDRDESRFAEASHQMVETGNYVDIRFASGPRYNKPIGIYWLQSLSAALAGPARRARIWVYRIPSLIAGMLATLFLYAAARRIASRETAVISALFLGTTLLFTAECVIATTDAALLATVVAAQSLLLRAYLAARRSAEPPTTGYAMAGWVAVGFGILIKGPIILAVLAVTIIALSLWDRDFSWLKETRALYGAALALLIVLPWAVAIGYTSHGTFYEQSLGRDFTAKIFEGQESHGASPGYYLVETAVAFWPATLVLLPALVWAVAQRRDPFVRFLLAWSAGVWLLFEFIPTKLPHYILPAYPALALLCGLWITRAQETDSGSSQTVRNASALLFVIGAAAVAVGCVYLPMRFGGRLDALLISGTALASAGAAAAAFFLLRNNRLKAAGAAIASALLFDVVLGLIVVPQLHDLWLSPPAAKLVADNRRAGDAPPVVTGYVEPSLVFLLGPQTRVAPAAQAAGETGRGGLALVEKRAAPEFLSGVAAAGRVAKALGYVSGLDYSIGRKEQITLYRVMPGAR